MFTREAETTANYCRQRCVLFVSNRALKHYALTNRVYKVERADQNGIKYTVHLKCFHFQTTNERIQAIFQFLRSHEPLPF